MIPWNPRYRFETLKRRLVTTQSAREPSDIHSATKNVGQMMTVQESIIAKPRLIRNDNHRRAAVFRSQVGLQAVLCSRKQCLTRGFRDTANHGRFAQIRLCCAMRSIYVALLMSQGTSAVGISAAASRYPLTARPGEPPLHRISFEIFLVQRLFATT